MDAKLQEVRARAVDLARHPRTRKILLWFVITLVAVGVLVGLVAPPLIRDRLALQLSKMLHREVSIQQLRINPYSMSVWVRGFLMKERQGSATEVSFDELYVNLELMSVLYRGVVIKEIRLVKPYINLIRNDDRTYNFTDLIEEFTKGPSGPTPRFSLNNIEVIDGKIDFDDRPEKVKHAVTSIRIGVPFISSIPYYADVKVAPAFSALVNGSPLEIKGETKPFKDSRESTVHLDIDKLQIPKYLEYSPVGLNFTVPSGQIDGKLTASFITSKDKPSVLTISGNVDVQKLEVQELGNSPLLSLPLLGVVIDAIDVFGGRGSLKAVKLQGPELHLTRNRNGDLNLTSLVGEGSKEKKSDEKKDGKPFSYRVDEVLLDEGKLYFTDHGPEKPYQTLLENIHLGVKGLTNEPEKKAAVALSFQSDAKEQFDYKTSLQLTPLLADGEVEVKALQLKGLRPYYESVLGVEIKEGQLDLTTHFGLVRKEEKTDATFTNLNAALRSSRLDVPGDAEPLWRTSLLAIKDTTVDVGKKSIVIGALESRDGNGFIHRDPDGTISYARIFKAKPAETEAKQPEKKEEAPWTVETKRVALDRFRIVFEDRALGTPERLVVSDVIGRGENFSNAKNSRGKVRIQAKVNNKGILRLVGSLGTNPPAGRFDVEAREIEVVPFQPYLADQVNFALTDGAIGTKGNLTFDTAGDGPAKVSYEGNLQVTDFGTVEKSGSQDLLKWKSLLLDGIQFSLEPVQVRVNDIALSDFYARVMLGSDGKFNLQNLTVQKKADGSGPTESAKPPAQATEGAGSSQRQISIGNIKLSDGNVNYSDFFVKPNYSANLTGVQGSISELKAEAPGDVDLQAKIDNAAPVDIKGKINPLGKDLYLDIKASATDIELPTLTTYSGKYVGYGIERGKLTFRVQYQVENRKLAAENQIILNQLTFGEKVESPEATKLPVLLAVALLKDRNGVIDINLPISGSLDDPKFSVGGIVLQIILNIIVKAVTSPFALLGAAFGGGEELSMVEFDYGRADLTQAAEARLKSLATALENRPGLRLDISGRVDPVNDREGLKRLSVERKVKAQKMKELTRQGTAPRSVDDVKVEPAEYGKLLAAAYGEESFPKPRNIIGLAKELPVPEMEKLMQDNAQATDEDLRQLAGRRAQVVQDYLLSTGHVSAERLFIVASSPASAQEKDKPKGKESRVDFALK